MKNLGQTIKSLREERQLPLRKVAAYLDIDQAILSKIEHGARTPKRELVIQMAGYFKVDKTTLLVKWLADKILLEVAGDEMALDALELAGKILKNQLGKQKETGHVNSLTISEILGKKKMLTGDLPSFIDLARALFGAVAGGKFKEEALDSLTGFIGESKLYEVYLFYKPNAEWLKNNALTLNKIKELPDYKGKKRLIFASLKYVNDDTCTLHHVEFCKLPY